MAGSLLLVNDPAWIITVTDIGAAITLGDEAVPGGVVIGDVGASMGLADLP